MKQNRKPQTGRIHIHVYRGRVDRVSSRGLREPVELIVHDHDVQSQDDMPAVETMVYELGKKSKQKAR